MPTFEVQTPAGKFRVTAPADATEQEIRQRVLAQMSAEERAKAGGGAAGVDAAVEELRAEGVPEEQLRAMQRGGFSVKPGMSEEELAQRVNELRRSGAIQRRPADETRNLGRAAAFGQGLGFEAMDEAIGATQPEGFRRDVAVDEIRQMVGDLPIEEQIGLKLGGGLGTAVGAVKGGATLGKGFLPAVGEGSIYGGLFGAGAADQSGVMERLQGAGGGAALGGVAGGAGHYLLSKVGQGWDGLKNSMMAITGKPQQAAYARAVAALEQTGMNPQQIQQRLDDLGPEAVLLDIGEPTRALGRSAANVSPAAREAIETRLAERMAGQPDRLTDSLLRASNLDEPKTLPELFEAIRAESKPAIDAAYAEARSLGNDIDLAAFDDLAQAEMVSVALSQGRNAAQQRMIADAARSGVPLEEGAEPSALAVLDETKRVLDDIGEVAARSGERSKAELASSFSKSIRERVDGWMTEYADARGLASNMFGRLDDAQLGAEGAKPRPAADFGRRAAAAQNPEDVARGYAAGTIDKIEGRRATPGLVDAVFGSKRSQDALAAALRNQAADVQKQIAAERTFGATDRAVRSNSTTARQLMEMNALPAMAGAGLGYTQGGQDVESGLMGLAAALLLRKGGAAGINAIRGATQRGAADELGQILLQRGVPTPVQQKLLQQRIMKDALSRGGAGQAGANSPF